MCITFLLLRFRELHETESEKLQVLEVKDKTVSSGHNAIHGVCGCLYKISTRLSQSTLQHGGRWVSGNPSPI